MGTSPRIPIATCKTCHRTIPPTLALINHQRHNVDYPLDAWGYRVTYHSYVKEEEIVSLNEMWHYDLEFVVGHVTWAYVKDTDKKMIKVELFKGIYTVHTATE